MSRLWPRVMADRPGRFIVLVGPDGSGKTTLARALLDRWSGEKMYVHWIPKLRSPIERNPGNDLPRSKDLTNAGSSLTSVLRLTINMARAWLAYLFRIRRALDRKTLVVCDRWGYGYLGQPAALRYRGPEWLARLTPRLLPLPDLTVVLVAHVEVLSSRKSELTVEELELELERWDSAELPNKLVLDSARPVDDLADAVESRFDDA